MWCSEDGLGGQPCAPQGPDSSMHLDNLCHTLGSVLGSVPIRICIMVALFLQISCYYNSAYREEGPQRGDGVCAQSCRGAAQALSLLHLLFQHYRRLWTTEGPPHIAALSHSETLPRDLFLVVIFSPLNHPRSAHLETGLKTTDFFGINC